MNTYGYRSLREIKVFRYTDPQVAVTKLRMEKLTNGRHPVIRWMSFSDTQG